MDEMHLDKHTLTVFSLTVVFYKKILPIAFKDGQ